MVVLAGGCAAAGAAPDLVPARTPHRKDRYQPPSHQLDLDNFRKVSADKLTMAVCTGGGKRGASAAAGPRKRQQPPPKKRRQSPAKPAAKKPTAAKPKPKRKPAPAKKKKR